MERIHIPSLNSDDEDNMVVDTDPTGRFERYQKCLGMGAYKKVYLGFDQEEGMEVAWNELRLDHMQKKDINKVLSEVQLLQQIRHESIINFYHSWVAKGRNNRDQVFFITELMTSGTLKSYIKKTKGAIKPKVIKNWCRQILRGLQYLHSRDPPIIHRDLKCDNVFINGNNGQAKIGDLGLATVKEREYVSSVLGTPEFMAPELYEERYDEKIDIYAFGMCVLEMATKEYPYNECSNQAQIYRKVTNKVKPLALNKILDPDMREFVELCIRFDPASRPSALQLLQHSFLAEIGGPSSQLAVQTPAESMFYSQPASGIMQETASMPDMSPMYDRVKSPATDIYPVSAYHRSLHSSTNTSPKSAYCPDIYGQSLDAELAALDVDRRLSYNSPGSNSNTLPGTSGHYTMPMSARTVLTDFDDFPDHCSIITVDVIKVNLPVITLRMLCVANKESEHKSSGKQEVTFPFNLREDTVEDVVDEMVNVGVLEEPDRLVAVGRIRMLVQAFVSPGNTTTKDSTLQVPIKNLRLMSPNNESYAAARTRSRSVHTFFNMRERSHPNLPSTVTNSQMQSQHRNTDIALSTPNSPVSPYRRSSQTHVRRSNSLSGINFLPPPSRMRGSIGEEASMFPYMGIPESPTSEENKAPSVVNIPSTKPRSSTENFESRSRVDLAMEALQKKQKQEAENLAKQHIEEWLTILTEKHQDLEQVHAEDSTAQSMVPAPMIVQLPSSLPGTGDIPIESIKVISSPQIQAESELQTESTPNNSLQSLTIPDIFWSWPHEDQLSFLQKFLNEIRNKENSSSQPNTAANSPMSEKKSRQGQAQKSPMSLNAEAERRVRELQQKAMNDFDADNEETKRFNAALRGQEQPKKVFNSLAMFSPAQDNKAAESARTQYGRQRGHSRAHSAPMTPAIMIPPSAVGIPQSQTSSTSSGYRSTPQSAVQAPAQVLLSHQHLPQYGYPVQYIHSDGSKSTSALQAQTDAFPWASAGAVSIPASANQIPMVPVVLLQQQPYQGFQSGGSQPASPAMERLHNQTTFRSFPDLRSAPATSDQPNGTSNH